MTVNITPLHDRVLVRRLEEKETVKGGIIVPDMGLARRLVHGKASPVHHDGQGLFAGLPPSFEAGRYHSLAATRVPDELEVCATCDEGEVMAVGAGKIEKGRRVPLEVKVGDRILFGKYTGSDIKIDEQEYLILREDEILARISGMAKAASGKK